MNTISYKGKEYPIRTLTAKYQGHTNTMFISVESLSLAIGINDDYDGTLGEEEEGIDQSIYFYVPDEVIELPAFEICKDCLDVPMEFIKDEDDEEDYSNRSCTTCSLGQSGKCEMKLEKKCISNTNNEKHKDYWIDKDED